MLKRRQSTSSEGIAIASQLRAAGDSSFLLSLPSFGCCAVPGSGMLILPVLKSFLAATVTWPRETCSMPPVASQLGRRELF
jgi:hypothetical protein